MHGLYKKILREIFSDESSRWRYRSRKSWVEKMIGALFSSEDRCMLLHREWVVKDWYANASFMFRFVGYTANVDIGERKNLFFEHEIYLIV